MDEMVELARWQKGLRAQADRWARGVGLAPAEIALREVARWQFGVYEECQRRGETPPPLPSFFDVPDDAASLD